MSIKLMYITNRTEIAKIAEAVGVDRIFVDMERLGKAERQKGRDSVQSGHTLEDVRKIKKVLKNSRLLTRINPMHEALEGYCSSKEEIDAVIEAGTDMIMLPYFKTVEEVREFIDLVAGRAKTIPLVETPEAVALIDEILALPGIDEIFVGLNDLSMGYKKRFMFELLSDGTVEMLCKKFKESKIPYGFGGIASLGKGLLPAEYVIKEHYRMGSTCAILSRSFCNINQIGQEEKVRTIFEKGVREIREFEKECERCDDKEFYENQKLVAEKVDLICKNMK